MHAINPWEWHFNLGIDTDETVLWNKQIELFVKIYLQIYKFAIISSRKFRLNFDLYKYVFLFTISIYICYCHPFWYSLHRKI